MATSKTKRRAASAKPTGHPFIGAKRVGSKVVVFKEVTSRKRGRAKAKITKRSVKASPRRQTDDWMEETSLVSSLLPGFRSAVKEAISQTSKKPTR